MLASKVIGLLEETRNGVGMHCRAASRWSSSHATLCLRLSSRFPDLKIAVGRWGLKEDLDKKPSQIVLAELTSLAPRCRRREAR